MAENTPVISEVAVDLAWEAAQAANLAFDVFHEAEEKLIKVQEVAAFAIEGVVISDEAHETLDQEVDEAETNFDLLVDMAGVVMSQPHDGDASRSPWSAETSSTPEAKEVNTETLRECLLKTFGRGYKTYSTILNVKNGVEGATQIEQKGETVAMEVVMAAMTGPRLEKMVADLKRHEADPEAGFDILILPDVDFTGADEKAVASRVQQTLSALPNSWNGEPFADPEYHNDNTAYKSKGNSTGLRVAFAPRHANIPEGDVKTQNMWIETENGQGVDCLRTANDLEEMAHILVLADAGELDDPNTRFDKTYSRKVEDYQENENGVPVDHCVSGVCVYGNGRFYRDRSHVDDVVPGRVLVV